MGVNYFEECTKCVPPKRYPGCHSTCPDYAKGRAKLDADKARANKTISLKYYANERLYVNKDAVAKYARRRPRNHKCK